MRRRHWRPYLWAAVMVACFHQARAMDPERLMSQYVRQQWGSESGLQGEVLAITQTDDGYLWVGTDQGLFRFDGRVFHRVEQQAGATTPITRVVGLAVDDQGNLIVRLPERNLLRYVNGSFENILELLQPRELAVTTMTRAGEHDVLVSGLTNGTLRYSNGRFSRVVPNSALPASPVTSLAQTSDGRIWLGTRDAGLFYAHNGNVVAITKGLPGRRINSLLAIGTEVWIGTDAGMARWNGSEVTAEGVAPSLRHVS